MKLKIAALSYLLLIGAVDAIESTTSTNSTKNYEPHPVTDFKDPPSPSDTGATTADDATSDSKRAHLRKESLKEDSIFNVGVSDSADVVPLGFIVTLDPEYSHEHFDRFMGEQLADAGAYDLVHRYSEVMHGVAVRGVSEEDIRKHPGVIKVEADKIIKLPPNETTGKVYATAVRSWGIDRINQPYLPLDSTYTPTYLGRGVDVYIVDTGIDTTHVEFSGGGRTIQNLWAAPGMPLNANNDDDGHGTHVAGTVGGNSAGVSRGANLFGIKVFNAGANAYDSDIIAGLDQVAIRHRAVAGRRSVVNMSLGGSCSGTCSRDALVVAANSLVAKGVVVVVAAGNSNVNACTQSPAAATSAITVAASTRNDYEASYSNWGSCVDLFAPGSDIVSACASSQCRSSGSYTTYSGTSMAAPHVAGVAAQILDMLPRATPASVASSLNCMVRTNVMLGVTPGTKSALLQQVFPGDHCVPGAVTKFEIKTQYSSPSRCIDISGWAPPGNGRAVQLWDCNGTGAQRLDYYSSTKEFKLSAYPTYCLDIPNSDVSNGVKLQMWTCTGGSNQKFGIYYGEIYSYINFDKCVDVPGQNFARGQRLQIYDCNRTPAQLWYFNKF